MPRNSFIVPHLLLPTAESLSTLKFANRAKCMRNLPKVGGPASLPILSSRKWYCGICAVDVGGLACPAPGHVLLSERLARTARCCPAILLLC